MKFTFKPNLYDGHVAEYVQKILDRDNVHYEKLSEEGTLIAYIDDERFAELMEDVACEAERTDIPVYGMTTLRDPEKLARLQRLNGTTNFEVLSSQKNEFQKMKRLDDAAMLCAKTMSADPLNCIKDDLQKELEIEDYMRNGCPWTADIRQDAWTQFHVNTLHPLQAAEAIARMYARNATFLYMKSCMYTSSPKQFADAFSKKICGQILDRIQKEEEQV